MEVEMLINNLFVRPEEVKSTPQRHEARALSHATAIPQFTGDLRAIAHHNTYTHPQQLLTPSGAIRKIYRYS